MTDYRVRAVEIAENYLGAKEGGALHKRIVKIFNEVKPDGGAMTTSAPWCACFVSAVEIEALGEDKAKKYCPLSYNCGTIISKAQKMGIWVEDDAYNPRAGEWILYDWQDSGKGDNHGGSDHVGIVEKVTKKQITIIEGNKNDSVERRVIKRDGRYIRGYVAIPYDKMGKSTKTTKTSKAVKVGATVRIKRGANQYGTTRDFASFVYDREYKVVEIHGNRVVFASGKTVIGAVRKQDCIVQ